MPSLLDLGTVDSSLLPVLIDEVFTYWCTIGRFLDDFISGKDNYSCGHIGVVPLLLVDASEEFFHPPHHRGGLVVWRAFALYKGVGPFTEMVRPAYSRVIYVCRSRAWVVRLHCVSPNVVLRRTFLECSPGTHAFLNT